MSETQTQTQNPTQAEIKTETRTDTHAEVPIEKQTASVAGHRMAYVDRGSGPTVAFLHGNPTSSYLWRAMIAGLEARFRCLAPDLIGMGDSQKLEETGPSAYGFATHQRFVDGWFDAVVPEGQVVLVVHDWGSALGLDWARRHPERVRGVAYMEAILGNLSWAALPPPAREYFEGLRGPAGEEMVLRHNAFVETILAPGGFLQPASPAVAAEYRRPFATPGEGRRPTLSWPRMLPFDGEPKEIAERVARYVAWFAESPMPKLFIACDPGRILVGPLRQRCLEFPHQTNVTVPGLHYPQEDSPRQVTEALREWLAAIASGGSPDGGAPVGAARRSS